MIKKIKYLAKTSFLVLIITFVLFEIALRILPIFVAEPLKSSLIELDIITNLNERVYRPLIGKDNIGILLPPTSAIHTVFIGDSFMFGYGVANDATIPEQYLQLIKNSVVNLGQQATNQVYYNRMMEIAMRYKPKTIVYGMFINDFDSLPPVKELEDKNILRIDEKDIFVENYTLNYKLYKIIKIITNYSKILQFSKQLLHNTTIKRKKEGYQNYLLNYKNNDYLFFEKNWIEKSYKDTTKVAEYIRQSIAYVKEAAKFAQKHNTEFIVILFPYKNSVYGNFFVEKSKIYSDIPSNIYSEFTKKLENDSINICNLEPDFIEEAKKGSKLYFTIDGHFNEQGNKLAAKLITKYIESKQLKK